MADLDELLDGALDDFREAAPHSQASAASSVADAAPAHGSQAAQSNTAISFQFDPPCKNSSTIPQSAEKGPVLPPRPARSHKGKGKATLQPLTHPASAAAASAPSHREAAADEATAESSAGGPADLTATLAALAQPSTAGSPGGGPDLTTTLRAAAAAEARSREGQAGEAALLDGDSDSLINALTAQMREMGESPEDPGVMDAFVSGLLQQLLSKDVLYQSMQDIRARYPLWLERHADTLDHEVLARYTQQHQHIIDICHLYDTDEGNFDAIYAKLQQMQSCGTPPKEIVQELSPGLKFDDDGLPQLSGGSGAGCPMQ